MATPRNNPRTERADPVDIYVGHRLRLARSLSQLTQMEAADLAGISHQMLQKYEQSISRVSAGRLWQLARIYNVPVSFFFEDMPAEGPDAAAAPTLPDILNNQQAMILLHEYSLLTAAQQRAVRSVVKAMADPQAGAPADG